MSAEREGECYKWVGPIFVLLPCRFFRAGLSEAVSMEGRIIDCFYFQARNEDEAMRFAGQVGRRLEGVVAEVNERDREEFFASEHACYFPNLDELFALNLAKGDGEAFLGIISS